MANLYIGVDPGTNPNPFTSYSFVVTGLTVGGTYQLRFAEVDNQFFFNTGIDNVVVGTVPEPASLTLVGLAAFGVVAGPIGRRRKPRA